MDWPRIAVPALAFLLSCGSFASAALAPAHARFQWPAAGRLVVASCGGDVRAREVTLALRPGAAIHATDSGRVAYAGNELKGFDSVIFIRHFGDWVSAYALSGTILVKRGDVVERGQAIALSDRTDLTGQNELRFALRHRAVPVDPLDYLGQANGYRKIGSFCSG